MNLSGYVWPASWRNNRKSRKVTVSTEWLYLRLLFSFLMLPICCIRFFEISLFSRVSAVVDNISMLKSLLEFLCNFSGPLFVKYYILY